VCTKSNAQTSYMENQIVVIVTESTDCNLVIGLSVSVGGVIFIAIVISIAYSYRSRNRYSIMISKIRGDVTEMKNQV